MNKKIKSSCEEETVSIGMKLSMLRGLLNYHERMMLSHQNCPAGECKHTEHTEGKCPNAFFIDGYAETLREAIRCFEIVHKEELAVE